MACAAPAQQPHELPADLQPCARPAFISPVPVPADHVVVVLQARSEFSGITKLSGFCLVVDGKLVNPESPDAGLRDLKGGVDFPFAVRAGTDHSVDVVVTMTGTGNAEGYRFQVRSKHAFTAKSSGSIDVTLTELGTDRTPVEQRPTIVWTEKFAARSDGGV